MLRPTHAIRGRSRIVLSGVAAGALLLIAVTTLSGCTGEPTKPAKTHTAVATATPTATPTQAPILRQELSATQNLAFFDYVNQKTLAANPDPVGKTFIDGLVAAGFNKADMSVTADKTTINLTPGSIQFSVLFNGQCLLGQYGPDGVGYHSQVAAVLSTGKCLIGETASMN
jgi:hypothetical protein